MEEQKYKRPKPGKGDVAYAVVRAGLSSIPAVGGAAVELFQFVLAPPLERRRDEWMEQVGEALRDLEANRGVKLEELQANDVFIDTALKASQIAFRNSQEEKRRALRNAIYNAALPNPPEQSLQQIFLDLIDSFTVWHLRILKLFDNPQQWARENNHRFPEAVISGSLAKDILESAFPEFRGKRTLYDQIWQDLYQKGLINTDSLHTMMSRQGLLAKRASDLGTQFLRFVEEPD
jgi:hypothetical protein